MRLKIRVEEVEVEVEGDREEILEVMGKLPEFLDVFKEALKPGLLKKIEAEEIVVGSP